MTLLKYFLLYELAAFLVNKQGGAQKLPFDLISALIPPPAAPTAHPTGAQVQFTSPVGRMTLTTPLLTPDGGITS
jgi:hypothetical protein